MTAEVSLRMISDNVMEMSGNINEIAQAISQQVDRVSAIDNAISQIDDNNTKQVTAFGEVASASKHLSVEAEDLRASSSRYTGQRKDGDAVFSRAS